MADQPDIDFERIRPYGQPASRAGAFEELASTLIERGAVEWPAGVQFYRFGNPDGGREGKGVLTNGDVWAWQTKYLFDFDASAAGQVSRSISRVLEVEPQLVRYFVSLPMDLPAGDTANRNSAFTRWNEKVEEWKALACERGLNVDFEFIGAHRLVTELTEPRHAGRARYWFGADLLTPEWQGRRLDEVIAKAGHRYTPRLHVEVETVRALDAVGRTDAYLGRWQTALAALREARRWPWRPPEDRADAFEEPLSLCARALNEADLKMEQLIAAARTTARLPPVLEALDAASSALFSVDDLLHAHSRTRDGYFIGDAASLYSHVRKAVGAINRAMQLARSPATRAADEAVLLLTGRAGAGKTHLLCDVASRRIAAEHPTILILGQDFDGRSLLQQIPELSQLGGSLDDVLAVLDAAAEAAKCTGLLMLDAINEGERPERWRDDLRALRTAVDRYPNVALVIACRTEFVDAVVGNDLPPAVEHVGFAEATDTAILRFTHEYGLEPPTFPVLNPEFSNPLFLKLTCEALATLGSTRFPLGAAGLVTVCNAFLEAVNKRLAEPARCDYDEHDHVVAQVVRELALAGRGALDRVVVQQLTDAALPGRSWSRSLMRGLLAEGVLIELSDGRITFGYQRLGDVTRAAVIADKTPEEIRAWLEGLGDAIWGELGVLGALAVIIPERHQQELVDLALDDERRASGEVIGAFIESLLLRAPESVSDRTVEVVEKLLDHGYRTVDVWDHLLRVACVPGHRLNAEWLHARLAAYEVWERDLSWSALLIGATDDYEQETAVERLIEWAWPQDLSRRAGVPDDVASLATLVLAWFLTTSDRRVRDRATKALVSIGEQAPRGFAQALIKFRGVNDPYVIERLVGAACAIVLRTDDAECSREIADALLELVADDWPPHLLTRDFIRRVFDVALDSGWTGSHQRPPYGAAWPVTTRTVDEIEQLAGPPDYEYGSIWYSLAGMGDFGRYILQSALGDVHAADKEALRHDAERAIFDRALELGWTPERFADLDRGRGDDRERVVERVGKKYQWIGFYEVMGRIADNHMIKRTWEDTQPRPYEYAEQLVWRDIDPTVLARKPETADRAVHWFSPVQAEFPDEPVVAYPVDMAGVPDPLDLIAVSDEDGEQWLVLVSAPSWDQALAPEIEALRVPKRAIWMQLHAYLVPTADAATVAEWARGKDWFGRWMPDIPDLHNLLLGAHPNAPEWSPGDGSVDWWEARADGPQPAPLWQCAAWYGGTGTSRDASADEETRGHLPTRRLFDALGLSKGVDFVWRDQASVAVFDPAVASGGPASLVMRRDLMPRLIDAGLVLFWTVLAGSELRHTDHPRPGDDYRWVSASAAYMLTDTTVEGLGASAARCRPGPETENQVDWPIKPSEP